MSGFVDNFIILFLASAPWLLVGLLIAGAIQLFVPASLMSKQLGKEGVGSAVKAAFIGAPLPLCSCGVIPAALGLRKAGASKSATTAFLVATPETGIDSIAMSYALLGPFMAVIRPITAIVSAIVAGSLVGSDNVEKAKTGQMDNAPATDPHHAQQDEPKAAPSSCCRQKNLAEPTPMVVSQPVAVEPQGETDTQSCCATKAKAPATATLSTKLIKSFHYSITDLLDSTVTWLLVGLGFAAVVQTWLPEGFLAQWGSGIIAMVVMVLISVPMYICATASTPVAAGLLLSGVSPGAVLVFMMAGPATNVATLGVVAKELGKRAVAAYLFGVIGTAMLFGYFTDYIVEVYGVEVAPQIGHEHQMFPDWFVVSCGIILALLIVRNYLIRFGPKPMRKALWA